MSEREQAIEKVAAIIRRNYISEYETNAPVSDWYPEAAEIVDALASQPVVEGQITEEMVDRASATFASWRPSRPTHREAMRAALEAALGAPSQETGELERLREAFRGGFERGIGACILRPRDVGDLERHWQRWLAESARSSLSPNQPEGEKAAEVCTIKSTDEEE